MPNVPLPRVPGVHMPTRRRAHVPNIPEISRTSAVVDCAIYCAGCRMPGKLRWQDALDEVERTGDGFVWIGLLEPSQQQIQGIAERFGLHPLAVEEAVHPHQRPKLEEYGNQLFAVVKTLNYDDTQPAGTAEVVETGEVMVFVGANFVITVRHGSHGDLRDVRRRMEGDHRLLDLGPSAVLHSIMDHVVDDYVTVANALQEDVDEIETGVFTTKRTADSDLIYALKREVVTMRRATAPLLSALNHLADGDIPLIATPVRAYFSDVEDHLSDVVDRIGEYDEMLSALIAANLARVGIAQNEDMRKISAWVAIAAVPTMLAGIYGMNFDHMPELHWTFGYPLILLVMVCVCLGLYRMFKRNGWL